MCAVTSKIHKQRLNLGLNQAIYSSAPAMRIYVYEGQLSAQVFGAALAVVVRAAG